MIESSSFQLWNIMLFLAWNLAFIVKIEFQIDIIFSCDFPIFPANEKYSIIFVHCMTEASDLELAEMIEIVGLTLLIIKFRKLITCFIQSCNYCTQFPLLWVLRIFDLNIDKTKTMRLNIILKFKPQPDVLLVKVIYFFIFEKSIISIFRVEIAQELN